MKRATSGHLREWALITLLLGAALVAAVRWGWLERADFWLYDTSVTWSGRVPSADILILAIDEDSLARQGRWPWSRGLLADAMDRLTDAGAGPVLLDVIFSEPQRDDPGADARLATALARHGRVVLPVFMPNTGDVAVQPLPVLAAAAHLGHAQALVDRDGVSRRYMSAEVAGGIAYPHVAQVLMQLSTPSSKAAAGPTTKQVAKPAAALPEARLVPFAGPPGHFTRRPLADLLDGRIPAQELTGRVILLGATATGLGDNLVTPLAGSNGTMPGVEFVANVLDGLNKGLSPRPVDGWVRMALSIVMLMTLMAVLVVTTPQASLWATIAACAGAALVAVGALKVWGLWWAPAAPIVAMALAYPLWSWRRLEASLSAMTRETGRIAALAQPGHGVAAAMDAGSFFDPVETRIAAITRAVDQIATALATDSDAPEAHRHREDMMRHLAHDLRSPLVSLRSLAANLPVDRRADNAAMLNRIDECARRALDLSEQFLLMGRAEALDPAFFDEVDLVQILHQSADDLFEDARSAGSRVERRCTLDLAVVRGDARLLHRTLLNLGWNALRHGPRGGTITLSLEESVAGYTLTVHDEGTGFESESLAHLSQRYAQSATSNPGHGLGLALARQVAEKHEATLSAEHPLEGGFNMVFRLARQTASGSL